MGHSDDTEWVMSSRPNLSQRPGFLTGQDAALRNLQLVKEQSLLRERHQGMLWDKAGKDKVVSAEHYDDRLGKEGALPPASYSSRMMKELFSSRTETSAGSGTETGRERAREVLQENLDCTNVAFYSQGPKQEQQQKLSSQALKERIRLSSIHERRTKHEARILAGAEMEEMKKKQQEERRLKGIARQKLNHLALAATREEKRAACKGKQKNLTGLLKTFGPSNENSTLPGLQNKENNNSATARSIATHRSGLGTARFLTGGAVGGRQAHPQRNASGISFNDY